MRKIILLLTLVIFSSLSFTLKADTYPAERHILFLWPNIAYVTDQTQACVGQNSASYTYEVASTVNPYTCKRTTKSNGSVTYISLQFQYSSYVCLYGGTVSGSSCINAPPCTAPAVRNETTGQCIAPVVTCTYPKYNNNDVCVDIPKCPGDQEFFDVISKGCLVSSTTFGTCSKSTYSYCPPIDDCKPSSYICSNHPDAVNEAVTTRSAQIAAIKTNADAKKSEIESIEQQSKASAADKLSATLAAQRAKNDALTAAKQAQITGTASDIKNAITAYNKFAQEYIDALSKSVNSASASSKIEQVNIDAGVPIAAIPTSNPGNAEFHNEELDPMVIAAQKSLNDAVTGDGDGDGPGSGLPTSTGPSVDTSGLAKDTTLQGLSDKIGKLTDGFGSANLTSSPSSFYDTTYPGGISEVWNQHKTELTQTTFYSAIAGLTPQIGGAGGTCPSWQMPTMFGQSVELQPPCEIWPMLQVIFLVTSLFTARSLIFGG